MSKARILKQVAISSSKDLPDPGVEPASPVSPALAGGFFTAEPPGKAVSLQLLTTTFVGPLTCELSQSFRKFI